MKGKRVVCTLLTFFILAGMVSISAMADSRPVLSIDSTPLLEPGTSITVPLRLSDLPDGIYMLQLVVKYDPEKLRLTEASPGDIFSTVGTATINGNIAGSIYLIWDSTSKQITDDCVLLNMTFTALSQERCDTLVQVSESDECLLANWEMEYSPVLTPGTVRIGRLSDASVFQLPGGITSVESDSFEGVQMDIIIVPGTGTPLDLDFLNGSGTIYVVANEGRVIIPEQHTYTVITPEEYNSLLN